jgi:hypothetical protein
MKKVRSAHNEGGHLEASSFPRVGKGLPVPGLDDENFFHEATVSPRDFVDLIGGRGIDCLMCSAHPAFGSLLSRRLAQASFASRLGALLHYHTTTTTALTRQSQLARDDTDRLRYRRAPLERAKSTARPPFRPSSSPSSRTAPARPNIGRAGRRLQTTA